MKWRVKYAVKRPSRRNSRSVISTGSVDEEAPAASRALALRWKRGISASIRR